VRLATWNINGLRARLALLLRWLDERRPDVVGLQELKLSDDQFPYAALAAAGYRAAVFGQKAWNGVAVLSRSDLEIVQRGLPSQDAEGARLLGVKVGELSFTTLYVPNGKTVLHPDFPRKLGWLDALGEHVGLGFVPAAPAVLCGDFNVCPTPLDSWNERAFAGTIFHTDEERGRIRGLLGRGLHDLFREKHPERQAFSWWDYRAGAFHRGEGLRIDLLLATAPLLERLRTIEIDRDYRKKKGELLPSDHAPVIADFEDVDV
jgi:exodeoxyribonuclease-3